MHSSFTNHRFDSRRGRRVATGLAALAVAGAGAGAAQAHADRAQSHPTSRAHQAGSANQILEVRSTLRKRGHRHATNAGVTTEREYTDPRSGVRYLLLDQFPSVRGSVDYVSWEADTPQAGNKRSVEQVDVDSVNRTYSDRTATLSESPAPQLGIESTADQVRRAIQDGQAAKAGIRHDGGRTVLALTLPSDRTVRNHVLEVDPSSDAPVVETKIYTSGRLTFDYHASFRAAASSAVSRIEAKPTAPAGFTTSGG
jgi:hypothetical protein